MRSETKVSAAKKISAKAIMADLKAGSTDAELMEKYGISIGALQELFSKLIGAGLATQAYFNKRALRDVGIRQKNDTTKTCPHCGYGSSEGFTTCPRCDMEVSDWLNTSELTDILTGSFK
jgi:hypothetical protein